MSKLIAAMKKKTRQKNICSFCNLIKFIIENAPGGIRTPNPQFRRLMIYPVDLRAQSPNDSIPIPYLKEKFEQNKSYTALKMRDHGLGKFRCARRASQIPRA